MKANPNKKFTQPKGVSIQMKKHRNYMTSVKPAPSRNWHKIRRIDGRNKLYGEFEYQLQIPTHTFLEVRAWCWETWGPSIEYFWYNDYKRSHSCNSEWCFDTDFATTRSINHGGRRLGIIYLAGDQELDLFYLKWATKV